MFDSANVGSVISVIQNVSPNSNLISALDFSEKDFTQNLEKIIENNATNIEKKYFGKSAWSFEDNKILKLKLKIESKGIPFIKWKDISINRGITTGLNEIFIINEELKRKLILEDPKSEEILKPILKGANIKRYSIIKPTEYLIYTYTNIDIQNYEAVYKYLKQHELVLKEVYEAKHGQKKWYELRKCAYYDNFFEEKLVWTRLSNQNGFSISQNKEFTVDSSSFAVSKDIRYLCAILNSKLVLFYFKLGSVIWGKDGIKWFGEYFDNIPIPEISPELQQPFIEKVDKILALKRENPQANTTEIEAELDEMVFDLYELTADERAIVRG